jgi:hypothetical protein
MKKTLQKKVISTIIHEPSNFYATVQQIMTFKSIKCRRQKDQFFFHLLKGSEKPINCKEASFEIEQGLKYNLLRRRKE